MDMLKLKEYSEIKRIALMGARYAAKLEDEGVYDKYDLAAVLKTGGGGSVDGGREEGVVLSGMA
jgi:hypothetical protein